MLRCFSHAFLVCRNVHLLRSCRVHTPRRTCPRGSRLHGVCRRRQSILLLRGSQLRSLLNEVQLIPHLVNLCHIRTAFPRSHCHMLLAHRQYAPLLPRCAASPSETHKLHPRHKLATSKLDHRTPGDVLPPKKQVLACKQRCAVIRAPNRQLCGCA